VIVDDPAIYMADFGVTVVSGAISGVGIFDMPSEMIIDNQIITTDYTLTCAASEFGHLLYGSQVSVNGAAYTVRATQLVHDGVFVQISLQRDLETPFSVATASVDGNGAEVEIDDLGVVQLDPGLDGGTASSEYIDGNVLDGGAA
jgi:hypothetical protein